MKDGFLVEKENAVMPYRPNIRSGYRNLEKGGVTSSYRSTLGLLYKHKRGGGPGGRPTLGPMLISLYIVHGTTRGGGGPGSPGSAHEYG